MSRVRPAALAGIMLLSAGLACKERGLSTCDITERACQQSVYYRVLNLRGDGFDPFGGLPPVNVFTEDEFRAMLEAEQAAARSGGPNPWDKALVLLGFTTSASAPAGDGGVAPDGGVASDAGSGSSSIEDQVSHILAYYDPGTKTVTVISHPSRTGSHPLEDGMITLAHELVHALQDRELALDKSNFHGYDESLAYNAIIEGDARFYENLFTNDVRVMLGLAPLDATAWPDEELAYAYANFDQLGSPLFAARYLTYPFGAKYEATLYRSGGNAAVRHGYAKEPIRTVGFMVGADGKAPPVGSGSVAAAPAVCTLPTTNTKVSQTVGEDQFGAVPLYTFLRGWGVAHDVAFATAQTWTGDDLFVQASSDYGTTAVSWRIEFSASPPASIAQALSASGVLSVSTAGRALQLTVTDSPTPLLWQNACP
jgi:hypothetical protein